MAALRASALINTSFACRPGSVTAVLETEGGSARGRRRPASSSRSHISQEVLHGSFAGKRDNVGHRAFSRICSSQDTIAASTNHISILSVGRVTVWARPFPQLAISSVDSL